MGIFNLSVLIAAAWHLSVYALITGEKVKSMHMLNHTFYFLHTDHNIYKFDHGEHAHATKRGLHIKGYLSASASTTATTHAVAVVLPAAAPILPTRPGTVACHCALSLGATPLAMGGLPFGALLGGHAGLPFGTIGLTFLLGHAGRVCRSNFIRKTYSRGSQAEN
jgi:hypothetical protein